MSLAGRMTKFRIAELSGVDRPAQTGARRTIMKRETGMSYDEVMKREFSDDQRKELAGNGKALPDGSFPIETEEDLHNAVRAIGRAKDESKAKAHIISRAKSMGLTSALPDGWVKKELDMTSEAIKKALGLGADATEAQVEEAIKKNATAAETAKAEARAVRKASMTDAEMAHCKGMSDDDADDFMSKSKEDRQKLMAKALEGDETLVSKGVTIRKSEVGAGVFEILKAQAAEISANAEAIRKAEEAAADARFQKMADGEFKHLAGTVESLAKMLKRIYALPEADRDAELAVLKAADAAAKFAFSSVGRGGGIDSGESGAKGQLDRMAADILKADPKLATIEKAFDKAIQTAEGKELYDKMVTERRATAPAS